MEPIENEDQISGSAARSMRLALDLDQRSFWAAVGVKRDTGNNYEHGHTNEVPKPVRRLLFLRYVLGIPVDGSAGSLRSLSGKAQLEALSASDMKKAARLAEQAADRLRQAADNITTTDA